MKKFILSLAVILVAVTLAAQQAPKMLTLEQASERALATGLITQAEKVQVDSMITIFNAQRAELNKKRKTLSEDEVTAMNKKISGDLNNGLKKLMGNAKYSEWTAMRKAGDKK